MYVMKVFGFYLWVDGALFPVSNLQIMSWLLIMHSVILLKKIDHSYEVVALQ